MNANQAALLLLLFLSFLFLSVYLSLKTPSLASVIQEFEYRPQKSFLTYWPIPIGASFTYLFLIFTLKQWMKKREAFQLRAIMILHNVIMTTLSSVVFVGMIYSFIQLLLKHNFDPEVIFCDSERKEVGKGALYFFVFVFYLSKYYELIDTMLILLRKGNLQFLHAYHHWATLILVYVCLEVRMPVQWSAEALNALVHIPMYFYYLLAVFKIPVPWKSYLTILQIIQFIVVDVLHLRSFYYHYFVSGKCSSFDTYGNIFGFCVINSYLVLFILFYRRTYSGKSEAKKKSH